MTVALPAPLDGAGLGRLLARPGVAACLDALQAPGEETRLVGGCVRDALLGREGADIDLATTLPPGETLARGRRAGLKAVPTGFDHGTVTLLVAGVPHEVTTLREDVETDGRHAVVRFGRDFARDAERRDFTINALSLGPDGRLYDTTGGVADLAAGRVRFIGDPDTRILEDGLRILRFFRFHARYGAGAPDPAGLAAAVRRRDRLDRLSRERVRSELLRLLVAPGAVDAVDALSATGLLARLIGGVGDLGRFARAVASDPAPEAGDPAIRRLAALAVQSEPDADRLRERLRLANGEHARLAAYAGLLATLRTRASLDAAGARALAATHGPAALSEVLAAIEGEPRPEVAADARAALAGLAEAGAAPVFPVTGADLLAAGVPAGPAVGRGLAAARRRWLAEGCPTGARVRDGLLAEAVTVAGRAPEDPRRR